MLETRYRWLLLLLGPLAVCVALTIACFRPFWIPSGSMAPTLRVGDYLLVNRAAYGFPRLKCFLGLCEDALGTTGSALKRGDVVVFRHPVNEQDYIKRVVGLPLDEVQMVDGGLVLNGTPQTQTPLDDFSEPYERTPRGGFPTCSNGHVALGEQCLKRRAVEQLEGGTSHEVLSIFESLSADNTPVYEVPDGHVFVLGDNRDNSIDSRFAQTAGGVGFVPTANLIGRADVVLFNFSGVEGRSWTWLQ